MYRSTIDRVALVLTGIALVAVYAPTIGWLWGRWTMSVWHNAHGLLVPFVVTFLVSDHFRARPPVRPVQPSRWGFAFVIPALLLHVLDTGMHTELLSAVSIVLLAPGVSLLAIGSAPTKAIAFPLAFLAFALPIPLSMTELLHLVLRQFATTLTAGIVPHLGIPVFAEGTTLHLAHAELEIGDACSGFSTLYAAIAVACLTAYGATGTGRKLLVLASAAPLAVAANVLRIVMLTAIVNRTGIDVLDTWIHPASGMLTFALALPVIFWLGRPTPNTAASHKPAAAPVAP